ncbi:MAG: hypothetical protein WBI74_07860 [Caldicoprobacterales bacterium]|jgi:fatty-acid desaturase|nr:hypothetical protein [Clostridiales bacterium]
MLKLALDNLLNIDKVGLWAFIIAAFITYGAKFISIKILRVSSHKAFKVTVMLKILGVLIGLFGLIRITK